MKWPTQKYRIDRTFPLPRHKVWELLSDTDHLNRMIGLFNIRVMNPSVGNGGLFREVLAKVGGLIPLRWNESPFQWERNKSYSVIRAYKSGPMQLFWGGIEISDADGANGEPATFVRLFGEFTPANVIGVVAIPITGLGSMRRTMKYLQHYLKLMEQGRGEMPPQPAPSSPINDKELERLMLELRKMPIHSELPDKLKNHLLLSGDDGVVDMRPYELASVWGAGREDTLRMFLYATRAGITNLSWHLICPNCRVSKSQTETLSKISAQFHCDFCGINYEANFDRYVELCFSVNPAVRKAYKQVFCIGGPMITPHIHAQVYLQPGEITEIMYPEPDEEYRLRILKSNQIITIEDPKPDQEDSEALHPIPSELVFNEDGWSVPIIPNPGKGTYLTVKNEAKTDIVVALEKCNWDDEKVTAAKVTTMHEFRGMFSSEVLAPGQQVGIESVTLLFSDLLGSTAFYENVGDALAYGKVRRHFDFMLEWIHKNQGTLVKTIGDAVMAIFEKPAHAIQAALDIQKHVVRFNETQIEEVSHCDQNRNSPWTGHCR